jgi:hypothetical protein
VPAFTALDDAQHLGPLGAGWANAGQGRAAWFHDLLGLAGGRVGTTQLDRVQAAADGLGDLPDRVAGQRHGHPLGPGRGRRHPTTSVPWSPVHVDDQPHSGQSKVI